MFKSKTVLYVKGKDDKIFRFECEPTSTYGDVHDALETMKVFVLEEMKKNEKPLEEKSKDCSLGCS